MQQLNLDVTFTRIILNISLSPPFPFFFALLLSLSLQEGIQPGKGKEGKKGLVTKEETGEVGDIPGKFH